MIFHAFRSVRIACAAMIACTLFAVSASADNLVTNGSFEDINGATSNFFVNYPTANLPGGSGAGYGNDFIVLAGSNGTGNCGESNPIYDLWVSPGNSPDGGNYFLMDGDPVVHSEMYQTLSGLTAGDDYQVTFYQASGQLYTLDSVSYEDWSVYFGDQTQTSNVMTTPAEGGTAWESQTLNFVADSTSAVLGFIANGTPTNEPPIAFLDGISVTDQGPTATPEPSTVAMMFTGLLCIPAAFRRIRGKR